MCQTPGIVRAPGLRQHSVCSQGKLLFTKESETLKHKQGAGRWHTQQNTHYSVLGPVFKSPGPTTCRKQASQVMKEVCKCFSLPLYLSLPSRFLSFSIQNKLTNSKKIKKKIYQLGEGEERPSPRKDPLSANQPIRIPSGDKNSMIMEEQNDCKLKPKTLPKWKKKEKKRIP